SHHAGAGLLVPVSCPPGQACPAGTGFQFVGPGGLGGPDPGVVGRPRDGPPRIRPETLSMRGTPRTETGRPSPPVRLPQPPSRPQSRSDPLAPTVLVCPQATGSIPANDPLISPAISPAFFDRSASLVGVYDRVEDPGPAHRFQTKFKRPVQQR